jgi:5-methylcytosine-specific restriction enzyme A
MELIKKLFLRNAPRLPKMVAVVNKQFIRNPDVVSKVLFESKGFCWHCKAAAPFNRDIDGSPFLEVHHLIPLAEGGEDTVENAVALCPNCHRQAHFGKKSFNL